MAPLRELAQRYGLYLVEDAAQAHGAQYRGDRAGSLGDMACFSFYPGKNLGAWGEAGAVVTSNPQFAERLRQMRNHGQPERYRHIGQGFNYRMDAIQAAVLDVKLRHLDCWNRVRQEKALIYNDVLSGTGLTLPGVAENTDPAWHLYVVRHEQRDRIAAGLHDAGIGTGLHYPIPVHRQDILRGENSPCVVLPVTEAVSRQCLSLPLHPCLDDAQQSYVCERLMHVLEAL